MLLISRAGHLYSGNHRAYNLHVKCGKEFDLWCAFAFLGAENLLLI